MSDRSLVRKVIAGDPKAARAFVDGHYPSVLRALVFLTGSENEAVDLAQQTFLKARVGLAEFRFDSSLKTWLRKIAYHEYTHWLRSRGREVSGVVAEQFTELSLDGIVLAQAIGALPEVYREAFVLREIDRLSVREAAEVLGVPVGTVKSRCSEARAILVKKLGSTFGPSKVCEAENGK